MPQDGQRLRGGEVFVAAAAAAVVVVVVRFVPFRPLTYSLTRSLAESLSVLLVLLFGVRPTRADRAELR